MRMDNIQIHKLKTLPKFFKAQVEGKKNFEVRFNDRDYQIGDILLLEEFENEQYTGDFCGVEVIYILDDPIYCKAGYVIMGTKLITPQRNDE